MGKMKEIFIELDEQYNGNVPDDFDYESFLFSKEIEQIEYQKEILENGTNRK